MIGRIKFLGPSGVAGPMRAGIPVHYEYEQDYGERPISVMSGVLWCEINDAETNQYPGMPGHSFPTKDPERQHFQQTRMVQVPVGDSYGSRQYQNREEITEEMDICGYHLRKQDPFNQSPKAINGETENEGTVTKLEEENNQWQAGYDAAMERILNRPMTDEEKERLRHAE